LRSSWATFRRPRFRPDAASNGRSAGLPPAGPVACDPRASCGPVRAAPEVQGQPVGVIPAHVRVPRSRKLTILHNGHSETIPLRCGADNACYGPLCPAAWNITCGPYRRLRPWYVDVALLPPQSAPQTVSEPAFEPFQPADCDGRPTCRKCPRRAPVRKLRPGTTTIRGDECRDLGAPSTSPTAGGAPPGQPPRHRLNGYPLRWPPSGQHQPCGA
jgi:hypothetical protein